MRWMSRKDFKMDYWLHIYLNIKASLRCFVLFFLHFIHGVLPFFWTSHEFWESLVKEVKEVSDCDAFSGGYPVIPCPGKPVKGRICEKCSNFTGKR